jgi:excisionase family DNA binding protein
MRAPVVLLHRSEAAERLRVSVPTIKRWGARGLLDERRVGPKLVKITEASVEALIRKREDTAA